FASLATEGAPAERVALGLTLGVGLGPPILVGLYQRAMTGGTPAERLAGIALGAAAVAALSGVCFRATASAFRPLGHAHPYSLRTNFRREGLMPALLTFCAQVPNPGFPARLPLGSIGRGVANPGVLFVASQAGSVASRLFAGRLADRHGRATVLGPALGGVALTLAGMTLANGWF